MKDLLPTIPRETQLLQAQFDYFRINQIPRLFIYTWDDFTEGSIVEPDVRNGTWALLNIRQMIGTFYNETQNVTADQMLIDRWTNYPQLRNCTTIQVTSIPSIDLSC
ncbi:unnamed protein product [Didymodactylos carnosus]|uniref:Uncharacterized protein n=1 Tax=Didymodactylos carnosus TaxID=1234261 RepID=A0A8S2S4W2_9BILA|nr:unnamed protein product [Didymodactylos carnosus]CAF4202151.1 unnamed protein product [Didymodactylos carnosus]